MKFLLTFLLVVLGFTAHAQRYVGWVATTNELISRPPFDNNSVVQLKGLGNTNTSDGAIYQWIPTSTATVDLTNVFASSVSSTGRWIMVRNATRQFGAQFIGGGTNLITLNSNLYVTNLFVSSNAVVTNFTVFNTYTNYAPTNVYFTTNISYPSNVVINIANTTNTFVFTNNAYNSVVNAQYVSNYVNTVIAGTNNIYVFDVTQFSLGPSGTNISIASGALLTNIAIKGYADLRDITYIGFAAATVGKVLFGGDDYIGDQYLGQTWNFKTNDTRDAYTVARMEDFTNSFSTNFNQTQFTNVTGLVSIEQFALVTNLVLRSSHLTNTTTMEGTFNVGLLNSGAVTFDIHTNVTFQDNAGTKTWNFRRSGSENGSTFARWADTTNIVRQMVNLTQFATNDNIVSIKSTPFITNAWLRGTTVVSNSNFLIDGANVYFGFNAGSLTEIFYLTNTRLLNWDSSREWNFKDAASVDNNTVARLVDITNSINALGQTRFFNTNQFETINTTNVQIKSGAYTTNLFVWDTNHVKHASGGWLIEAASGGSPISTLKFTNSAGLGYLRGSDGANNVALYLQTSSSNANPAVIVGAEGQFAVNGNQARKFLAVSNSMTLGHATDVIYADTASGNLVFTASHQGGAQGDLGLTHTIKKLGTSANLVIITNDGTMRFEGASAIVLSNQNQSIVLHAQRTNDWRIVASHDPNKLTNLVTTTQLASSNYTGISRRTQWSAARGTATATTDSVGESLSQIAGTVGTGNIYASLTNSLYNCYFTAATADTLGGVQASSGGGVTLYPQFNPHWVGGIRTSNITTLRIWAGLGCSVAGLIPQDDPLNIAGAFDDTVAFRFSTAASDTTWKAVTCNSTATTVTDTGVTVAAYTPYRLEVLTRDGGQSWIFYINGNSVATNTTNLPRTNTVNAGMYWLTGVSTTDTVRRDIWWSRSVTTLDDY